MSTIVKLNNSNYCQYHIIGIVNTHIMPILIDTGAALSHVCKDLVFISEPTNPRTIIKFNLEEKILKEKTILEINFTSKVKIQIDIMIEEKSNTELLLGMDFLEAVKPYSLKSEELEITLNNQYVKIPRINLSIYSIKSHLEKFY